MEGTEAKRKKIGLTDMPLQSSDGDMLDTGKYAKALKKFILKCPTPMSIAVQGDWGTGKTSLIHMLEKALDQELKQKGSNIRYVYFNTWQYSQFGMVDDLYTSFVHALIRECAPEADVSKTLFEKLGKIIAGTIAYKVKKHTDIDIEELLQWQKEREEIVKSMKDGFADLVNKVTHENEDGRLIVCIDDLDRLNPEVAVELLEVIKLFMDVEKCVFVLAIDYDVVVSGVRMKYGQDMSEEKCRSFFDKIIQVPFRMPVEAYELQKMIKETVGESVPEEDISLLSGFIGSTLGANPRAYKRLANSFFLLQGIKEENMVSEDRKDKLENVLTFGVLCLQMCAPQVYQLLAEQGDFETVLPLEERNTLDGREAERAEAFIEFWGQLKKKYSANYQMGNILSHVLQRTSITSVVSGEAKNGNVQMKVDEITVNGKSIIVTTPTDALVQSYQELLMKQDDDLVEKYIEREKNMLTYDASQNNSLFRSKKELRRDGKTVLYIGVSSGTPVKIGQVRKLCEFLRNEGQRAEIIWKNEGQQIFCS